MKDTAYYKRLRTVENKLIDSLNKLEGKFGLSGFSERISRINNKMPRLKSLAQLDIISEFLEALIEIDELETSATINLMIDGSKVATIEADEPKAVEADEPKNKPAKRGRKPKTKYEQDELL